MPVLIAVALVLLHGIFHRLFRQAILQLKRGNGQAVYKEAEVERKLGFVFAVAELASDTEKVGRILLGSLGITGRRSTVEELNLGREMIESFAQHLNHAALGDLALQPVQKLLAIGAGVADAEPLDGLRLCGLQEGHQLCRIHRVLTVVILRIAGNVSGIVDQ